jgi:hypothetical protein
VNHVLVSGRDLDRNNMPRQFGCECQLAWRADGAVLVHVDRAAARHALQDAEQASAAGELRMRCHLD